VPATRPLPHGARRSENDGLGTSADSFVPADRFMRWEPMRPAALGSFFRLPHQVAAARPDERHSAHKMANRPDNRPAGVGRPRAPLPTPVPPGTWPAGFSASPQARPAAVTAHRWQPGLLEDVGYLSDLWPSTRGGDRLEIRPSRANDEYVNPRAPARAGALVLSRVVGAGIIRQTGVGQRAEGGQSFGSG
jgi:hypothetical protein